MQGTNFVVNLFGDDYQLWQTLTTIDEDRTQRFWLKRTGISCLEQITEQEYWELEELCRKRNAVYMGHVK